MKQLVLNVSAVIINYRMQLFFVAMNTIQSFLFYFVFIFNLFFFSYNDFTNKYISFSFFLVLFIYLALQDLMMGKLVYVNNTCKHSCYDYFSVSHQQFILVASTDSQYPEPQNI